MENVSQIDNREQNIAGIKERITKAQPIVLEKFNSYLGILAKPLSIDFKSDFGPTAAYCYSRHGSECNQSFEFRPHLMIDKGNGDIGYLIHETAHYATDVMLNEDLKKHYYIPIFTLSEGWAEYMNYEDPLKIKDEFGGEKGNWYEKYRKKLKDKEPFARKLKKNLSLNILKYQEGRNNNQDAAASWTGATLVKFIIENKGVEAFKSICQEVKIDNTKKGLKNG